MTDTNIVSGGNPTPPQPTTEPWYSQIIATFGRIFLIYTAVNFFKGSFTNQNQNAPVPTSPGEPSQPGVISTASKPIWSFGTKVNLRVYVTEDEEICDFNSNSLFWESNFVDFGSWDYSESYEGLVNISKNVQNNGTLYAHIYMVKQHFNLDPKSPFYSPDGFVHFKHTLTRYQPQRKVVKKKKLLGDSTEELEDTDSKVSSSKTTGLLKGKELPIVSYWHRNLTLNLVNHEAAFQTRGLPPPVLSHIRFASSSSSDIGAPIPIFPIFFINEFWVLKSNLNPINETTETLPLYIVFDPLSMWKFQLLAAMDVQLKSQMELMGGDSSELDLIKSTLMDTNPWLLGLTMIVSLLHSLFDFLAFKNDIAFWKDKKDNIGVSVRTLLMNIVFQIIIFLYLLDNSESTSWMVLLSTGVGVAIEAWKVKKALNATFVRQANGILPYTFVLSTKEKTELEDKTDEYDSMAYQYLSYAAYPLLFAYSIYSIFYEDHKGWYSFLVNTAVGFVYTFGFITMTPQLFINYKLKSVAHMPWKTFMYKSLNTFVDDLFAFIIKMPTLHRLACLRDDVVFFVYLYQRWIYKEDPNRPNEFGQVAGSEDTSKTIETTSEVKKNI